MSGGVDSSIAAMLLRDEGYDVSGVTMHFGSLTEGDQKRSCTSAAVDDARRVCERLKLHHDVFDYASYLEDKVISNFISEYQKGRTPNPCVECNRQLKFGALLDRVLASGFDFLATGHYAAIQKNEEGYCLTRPKDKKKDQSYFLYAIPYKRLKHILFPLARFTKDEVRELAKKHSLPVAAREESQDICFVTQKNTQEFLLERVRDISPGPITDLQGNVIGRHRGILFYTIGQRGGLGISHPTPLYVLSIDPVKNRIIVGEKKDLMAGRLLASDINMLTESWPAQVQAKIRYRKKEALCEISLWHGKLKVTFAEEQEAITPGQSIVFYDHERVLGGGIIDEVLHETHSIPA
jgi:tRNA-specific 2-thiouridylase